MQLVAPIWADHPQDWKDLYEVDGPVTVLSEGWIQGERMTGPYMVGGIVSPDLSTSAVVAYSDYYFTPESWARWWNVSGLDGRTGERLWNYRTSTTDDGLATVSGGAFSTDGATVFMAGSAGGAKLVAVDARSGEVKWLSRDHPGFYSDIVLSPNGARIYASGRTVSETENVAVAVNAETGDTIWAAAKPNDEIWVGYLTALSPDGERLFINANEAGFGRLIGLNTADGSWAWSIPRNAFSYLAPLAANVDSVFIAGTGSWGEEEQHLKLAAYDAATGEQRWILSTTPEEALRSIFADFAVSLDGSVVFLAGTHFWPDGASVSRAQGLHAFDALSGEELWAVQEPIDSLKGRAGPIAVDVVTGEVIATDFDSSHNIIRIRAHDPATGVVNWSVKRRESFGGAFDVKAVPGGIAVFASQIHHPDFQYGAYGAILLKPRFPFTFADWRGWYFTEEERQEEDVAGPDSDPGGFGVPNLLRYALGLDSHHPDRAKLPRPRTVAIGINGDTERYLGLTYRVQPSATDLEYLPEVSPDLRDWVRVPEENVMRREENPDGTETVTVADWVPMESDGADRRFMRLRVEKKE